MAVSDDVKKTLHGFNEAFNAGDADGVTQLFSRSSDALGIGSDPAEWWPGGERLASVISTQVGEMAGAKLELGETAGSGRWLGAQCAIVTPDGNRVPGRLTLVCGDDGKIEHFHFSVGVSNEEAIGQELTT